MRIAFLPAREEHNDFALSLYLSTMQPYTAELMMWDEGKQKASFAQHWRTEDVRVIAVDGREAGWFQFQETASEIWLQQLFVDPQGQGIGSEVLHRLLAEWCAKDKPVTLTVLKNNPARRLYERLGFTTIGETAMKIEMRYPAVSDPSLAVANDETRRARRRIHATRSSARTQSFLCRADAGPLSPFDRKIRANRGLS